MERDNTLSELATALRTARNLRGLSIEETSKLLLMSDKQIVGLENDDHSHFYTPYFAEKATTSYAEFLGLDTSLYKIAPIISALNPDPPHTPLHSKGQQRISALKAHIRFGLAPIAWICLGFLVTVALFATLQLLRTIRG